MASLAAQMDSVFALNPAAGVQLLAYPINFSHVLLRFIDSTAKNSGQRLDNVN